MGAAAGPGWHRLLVDAKIAELRAAMAAGETLPDAVMRRYGLRLAVDKEGKEPPAAGA